MTGLVDNALATDIERPTVANALKVFLASHQHWSAPVVLRRCLAFDEIMSFQKQATRVGFKGPVIDAGWAYRIGIVLEFLTTVTAPIVAYDQITGEQENLFPIVMDKWICRVGAGGKAQQPRTVA